MALNVEHAPEPPWRRVPGAEPSWSGWRHGDVWYVNVFLPFWAALSGEERGEYLRHWPPPSQDWVDYLADYASRRREPMNFEKVLVPPWSRYPGRGPRWIGWHFGEARFWLRNRFLPFWQLMRTDDRQEYLTHWPPPDETWTKRLRDWSAIPGRG